MAKFSAIEQAIKAFEKLTNPNKGGFGAYMNNMLFPAAKKKGKVSQAKLEFSLNATNAPLFDDLGRQYNQFDQEFEDFTTRAGRERTTDIMNQTPPLNVNVPFNIPNLSVKAYDPMSTYSGLGGII